MNSIYVELDGFTVHRYQNVDGDVRHIVWEPSPNLGMHFRLMFINGVNMGDLTTRAIPDEIKAMSYGKARVAAVDVYYTDLQQKANDLILRAFPFDFPTYCQICGQEKGRAVGYCAHGNHLVCGDCLPFEQHREADRAYQAAHPIDDGEETILDIMLDLAVEA